MYSILWVLLPNIGIAQSEPSLCDNLVVNGDFEAYDSIPHSLEQINFASTWLNSSGTCDYYHIEATGDVGIPCNFLGYQNVNGSGTAYAGLASFIGTMTDSQPYLYSESMMTQLSQPLLPDTPYELSIDLSLIEGLSANGFEFQAYLSDNGTLTGENFGYGNNGYLPISEPDSMLVRIQPIVSNSTGWQTVTMTFTTTSNPNLQFLYLGSLVNVTFDTLTASGPNVGECDPSYTMGYLTDPAWAQITGGGYYVDNVQIKPLECCAAIYDSNDTITVPRMVQRSDWIKTTDKVNNPSSSTNKVIYHAANFVEMNPGFETVMGSHYAAYIEDCDINDFVYRLAENQGSVNEMDQTIDLTKVTHGIKLYPNPSNRFVTISYGKPLSNIVIASIDGKVVLNQAVSKNEHQIDVSNFVNGLYIITVQTADGKTLNSKFIKN